MSVWRKLQFPKSTSSSWGGPYLLSVFGYPTYLGMGCWRSGRAGLGYSNWCVHPCLLGFWRKLLPMFFCNIMFMQPLPSLRCKYPFTFGFAWLSDVAFCIQVKIGFQQLGRKLPDTTVFLLTSPYLPMGSLYSTRKRTWDSETYWISKCVQSETNHTYAWFFFLPAECNPRLLWPLGFPDGFVMAFGHRLSIGWGIGGWYSEICQKL